MARTAKFKVYRTPIGFHDAYVAAPSQKAALEAWGSDANLFARGIAEAVTDADLTREPLANPGKVIRRSRGTTAEQIAALPQASADPPEHKTVSATRPSSPRPMTPKRPPPKPKPKPKPKPERGPLDDARRAIAEAEARYAQARSRLDKQEAELRQARQSLNSAYDAEAAHLQDRLDRVEAAYDRAMRKWREDASA